MPCLVIFEMGTLIVLCVMLVTSLVVGNPVPSAEYDVIVVGLGASGTAAGTTLAKAGKKVLALEAQDRVGGRVKTVKWGSGTVEEGAEWIHGTTNSSTYRLAQENNVTILQQKLLWSVLRSDGSEYDKEIAGNLYKYAIDVQEEPPEVPETLGEFIPRKLQEYIHSNYPSLLNDTDFLEGFNFFLDQAIQGYESANSWNDVTTSSRYTALEGSQEMSWNTYGYRTLFQILLNRYNNGPGIPNLEMKLSTEVTNIAWSPDNSQNVVVTTAGGETYTAPHVIVTPSLGVLKAKYKTLFTPALPQEKEDAINNISFGVCCKVILRFAESWWKKDGEDPILAFVWRMEDRNRFSVEDRWVTHSYGVTPSMSANDSVSVWFCGERAIKAEVTPNDVLQNKVMELIRTFASKKYNVPDPIEIMKSTWHSNPFVRGAYSFDGASSPQHPAARAQLATPLADVAGVARVLFAGEATESTHFSTVHGALDTGFREANRLLQLST